MKKLKEIEKTNGCTYILLEREGNWVMYSQAYSATPDQVIGYEIFRVRKTISGNERFPRTTEWGVDAFTRYTKPTDIKTYLQARLDRGVPLTQNASNYLTRLP